MLICSSIIYDIPVEESGIQIDENLITKIANGDKEAFLTLYEKCSNVLFAYSLSILRNREDAEDAMQDTFLKIRSAAHLYKAQGKPMAWIFTIARNICLMYFRKSQKVVLMGDDNINESLGLDQIESQEDRIVLEKAFLILPKQTCQIIMLHAVGGMKHREISELLDIPLSTVLSKYNRGIGKLRKELEGIL